MAGKNEPSLENHQERVPMRMTSMRLELLSRHRIRDPGLGLNEPSGLTLNADGSALYTVSDDTKAIFRLDLKGRVSVSDSFFIGLDDLEGIALRGDDSELLVVQERSNSVVVVKERKPGLLIELDSTLTTILSTRVLQASQGFMHPELKADKLDFSDLSYDSSSDTLWIVSDKGRCLFQYDWAGVTVLKRLDLTISTGDKPK